MQNNQYYNNVAKMIEAAGLEIAERAEDFAGSVDMMTDLNIWVRFPHDSPPTIEVTHEYVAKKCLHVLAAE